MKNLRFLLFFTAFAWFGNEAVAQVDKNNLLAFNEKRLQTNRNAMKVLGGWAVGNFLVSGLLIGRSEGGTKAFHQMNVGWNVINLGLAGFGYYSAMRADPAALDLYASVKDQYGIEKTFLLNAGLDVGYMLGGMYLTERAKNTLKNPDRLRGFGQSILLQGGFLFVFDLAMYFIVNNHGQLLEPLLKNVTLTGGLTGVGVRWDF